MKRFVRSFWGLIVLGVSATVATVALTGAGAGASYLILLGYLTLILVWMRIADLPAEWEAKARTGGGRSRDSR
jgi:O-antigen ligase